MPLSLLPLPRLPRLLRRPEAAHYELGERRATLHAQQALSTSDSWALRLALVPPPEKHSPVWRATAISPTGYQQLPWRACPPGLHYHDRPRLASPYWQACASALWQQRHQQ